MSKDICERFGERIREVRNQKNVTQVALCHKIGIEQKTLSAIENGNMEPCLRNIELLAIGLDVTLAKLFKDLWIMTESNSYPHPFRAFCGRMGIKLVRIDSQILKQLSHWGLQSHCQQFNKPQAWFMFPVLDPWDGRLLRPDALCQDRLTDILRVPNPPDTPAEPDNDVPRHATSVGYMILKPYDL
jgi:transcriptional regulator with XRE-family HTH domain